MEKFHGMEHPGGREVWLYCWGSEERGALVLGSSQSEDLVDAEVLRRRGLDLVKRQSGGGAVLVVPESVVWIDVFIPRDDPLWEDDVGKSALWLGKAWQATLFEFGISAEIHQGPYQPGEWCELICFAGRAAGEVFVDGKKISRHIPTANPPRRTLPNSPSPPMEHRRPLYPSEILPRRPRPSRNRDRHRRPSPTPTPQIRLHHFLPNNRKPLTPPPAHQAPRPHHKNSLHIPPQPHSTTHPHGDFTQKQKSAGGRHVFFWRVWLNAKAFLAKG